MPKVQRLSRAEVKALVTFIRPHLEAGKTHEEIRKICNDAGLRMPAGTPFCRATIAKYALRAGFRRRRRPGTRGPSYTQRHAPRASRAPRPDATPGDARLDQIADVLSVPGLNASTRLELVRILSSGRAS